MLEQLLGLFWDLRILPLLPLAEEMFSFFLFLFFFFLGGGGGGWGWGGVLILHENQAGT